MLVVGLARAAANTRRRAAIQLQQTPHALRAAMPDDRTDDDPRPEPPERPAPEDCCGSGCDQCVYELYEDALDRYRAKLAAWEQRQALRKMGSGSFSSAAGRK
jgi:hypothetical protein